MNKKGIFLLLFNFAALVILALFLSTIVSLNSKRNDVVGGNAVLLVKAYDEGEKIQLYLDMSSKFVLESSLTALANNGGYSSNEGCKTVNGFVVINECDKEFDPGKSFNDLLSVGFKSYLQNYESGFVEYEQEEVFGSSVLTSVGLVPEVVKPTEFGSFTALLEKAARASEVTSIQSKENKLLLNFKDIKLPVQNAGLEPIGSSYYLIRPSVLLEVEDLEVYNSIYEAIAVNCVGKDFSICDSLMRQTFSGISLSQEEGFTKLSLPVNNFVIKMAFHPSKPLKTVGLFKTVL